MFDQHISYLIPKLTSHTRIFVILQDKGDKYLLNVQKIFDITETVYFLFLYLTVFLEVILMLHIFYILFFLSCIFNLGNYIFRFKKYKVDYMYVYKSSTFIIH